ncbi:hypothetical protein HPA99_07150 [Streptococcus suis]|nr:hypothetical protein [Streptococcus suis]
MESIINRLNKLLKINDLSKKIFELKLNFLSKRISNIKNSEDCMFMENDDSETATQNLEPILDKFYSLKQLKVIQLYFEKTLSGYEIEVVELNRFETIYILNDSLPLLFLRQHLCNEWKDYYGFAQFDFNNCSQMDYYFGVAIVELLPNEIGYYYNQAQLVRELRLLRDFKDLNPVNVLRHTFKGFDYLNTEIFRFEKKIQDYNSLIPNFCISEIYDQWPGYKSELACLELYHPEGIEKIILSVHQDSERAVKNFCQNLIKYGEYIDEKRSGFYFNPHEMNRNIREQTTNLLNEILVVHKDNIAEFLEKNLTYFFVNYYSKEQDEHHEQLEQLINTDWSKTFNSIKRLRFKRSTTRWVSEYSLYKLVKKEFSDYKVIYQHRPVFLTSSKGGRMSYDIYISQLKIAIEYQGKQHFEPVDFFGGKIGFEKTIQRDKEKLLISQERGIRVIYYNYWEKISKEILRQKIKDID